ncbi:hypothetical protein QTJ16_006225 [Diplocarpon rosae]|uniref:Uncharacterized protein n=1 Tax=Diplocarpon rosae TaxID=946125 RepID=A0AAD9SX15_9HELO|nr:hypothetical protein QTJ16_006225 [Diplocarpon rosae]
MSTTSTTPSQLTPHDLSILSKIADPEASPLAPLLISSTLPPDPNVPSPSLYATITARERAIIASIQTTELQLANLHPAPADFDPLEQYLARVAQLNELVDAYPNYASARNNRAQALRRIYGDGILVANPSLSSPPAPATPASQQQHGAGQAHAGQALARAPLPAAVALSISAKILADLTTAIALLTPAAPDQPLSPQAAKTLAQAHTQRGALYHRTAQALAVAGAELRVAEGARESGWNALRFGEEASRDFAAGGRLGSEVARGLAVGVNPTAKLCGEMVREAMKREYLGAGTGTGTG